MISSIRGNFKGARRFNIDKTFHYGTMRNCRYRTGLPRNSAFDS